MTILDNKAIYEHIRQNKKNQARQDTTIQYKTIYDNTRQDKTSTRQHETI